MDGLDERQQLEMQRSGSLGVQWVDPEEAQFNKKKAFDEAFPMTAPGDNRMGQNFVPQLFFAKVLRSATEDEVKALFSRYGRVYDVNLFRAFQGAPTTKGCGLVTIGTHEEATAAIDALDNKYVWEGMEAPMVVKWMDAALQRRRREMHLAALRQGLVPNMAVVPTGKGLINLPANRFNLGPTGMMAPGDLEPMETPPAGCSPDALKLFVGNIPKSCTEEQLQPFFETIGKVVELVIVRDKQTHESKGSAFVWYASRPHAERAILQFNLRHVLPDPTGEQDRPLVVRKAKSRNKSVHPAVNMLAQGPQMTMAPQHYYQKMQQGGMMGGLDGMQMHEQMGQLGQMQGQHMGLMGTLYRGMQPMGAPQMVGIQGHQMQTGMYDAYGGGSSDQLGQESYGMAGPSHSTLDSLSQMALSLTLNQQQLAGVNSHLFSVQTVSGAQLHVTPGAPGLFHLVLTGTKSQVETAKNLLTTVLGQGSQVM